MEKIKTFFLSANKQHQVLDIQDTKGMMLTRDELVKVIAGKGNLYGATLASDVNVQDLKFDSIKMDKPMLRLLIDRGADVRGVDLSFQDVRGTDFTNVNLSYIICEATNFSEAIFKNTDLTGVDLSVASIANVQLHSVSCSEADRSHYINLYKNRLFFVLDGGDHRKNKNDLFYQLPEVEIQKLREGILFAVTESCFKFGKASKVAAAQDIVLEGFFDNRQVAICENNGEKSQIMVDNAKIKLLGDDFNEAQKTLFHHARSAMWQILGFNAQILDVQKMTQNEYMQEQKLVEIYIKGGHDDVGPRITPTLAEACFFGVLPYSILEHHLDLTEEQTIAVRELFLSPNYFW